MRVPHSNGTTTVKRMGSGFLIHIWLKPGVRAMAQRRETVQRAALSPP